METCSAGGEAGRVAIGRAEVLQR